MTLMVALPCEKFCPGLALGEDSICWDCNHVLCRNHYDEPAHACGYNLAYTGVCKLEPVLQDIDREAIRRRVRELRPNVPFQIKIPQCIDDALELSGGFNIHVEVSFGDGVEWLVRIPKHNQGDGPVVLLRKVLESEALTYKMLLDHGLPVAAVHHWGLGEFSKSKNPACRHIIYDRLPGSSSEQAEIGLTYCTMSEEDMKTFAESYAAVSIKISEIPCYTFGSLSTNNQGQVVWGPLLHPGYPGSLEAPFFGGPFETLRDAYVHRIEGLLELLKRGLIHRTSPLVHYLAFKEARRLVMGDPTFEERESTFYIRHPDCSGANILSKDSKVVGLIDWEWTGTTTKAAAFASPKWAHQTDAWLAGDNAITPEEELLCQAYEKAGRPDLASCVRNGRRYQRLDHLLFNWNPYCGENEVVGYLNALRGAFLGDDLSLPKSLPDWMDWAKGMQEGDPELAAVVELDEECRRLRHRRPENVKHEKTMINLGELLGDLYGPCED